MVAIPWLHPFVQHTKASFCTCTKYEYGKKWSIFTHISLLLLCKYINDSFTRTAFQVLPIERGAGVDQKLLLDFSRRLAAGAWCHIFPEGKTVQVEYCTSMILRGVFVAV